MGRVHTTLLIKRKDKDLAIFQIYVDDIIFGTTNEYLCWEFDFTNLMKNEFEMSIMGEFIFILGLKLCKQINASSWAKQNMEMICYINLV